MNGLSNLYNREDIEETILDNYVALLRHIKGEKKLHVMSKKPSDGIIPDRNCARCGTLFSPRNYSQKFCGDKPQRLGCIWKNIMDGVARAKLTKAKRPKMTHEERKAYMREHWHRVGKFNRAKSNETND